MKQINKKPEKKARNSQNYEKSPISKMKSKAHSSKKIKSKKNSKKSARGKTERKNYENKPRSRPFNELIKQSLRVFQEEKKLTLKEKNEQKAKNIEFLNTFNRQNIEIRLRNKERFNNFNYQMKIERKTKKLLQKSYKNQVFHCFFIKK